jgi:hypothetical protein
MPGSSTRPHPRRKIITFSVAIVAFVVWLLGTDRWDPMRESSEAAATT